MPAPPITESLTLETLVFERKAAAPPDTAFVETSGAACTVKYTFESHPEYPCYRAFDPTRPMRASPAAKMQASQTLVGRLRRAQRTMPLHSRIPVLRRNPS